MRHQVKGRHLTRTAEHRRALFRNLIAALFEHGRIRTTDAKAREVRPLAEKMITLGKRGDLHARRQAVRVVGTGTALDRLFGPIAQRFADRPGGYTRMVKAGRRLGDGAQVAYLELLDEAPRVVRAPAAGEEDAEGARGKRRAPAATAKGRGSAGKSRGSRAEGEGPAERAKPGRGARKAASRAGAEPGSGAGSKAASASPKSGGQLGGGSKKTKAASRPADRKGKRSES